MATNPASSASPARRRAWRLALKGLGMIVALGAAYALLAQFPVLRLPEVSGQAPEVQTQVLVKARAALLDWSRQHASRPGSLPCPDLNSDGFAEPTSAGNCPNLLGRYPWKTLGFAQPLRDRADELLWYALSPALRDDMLAQPLNMARQGQLSLDGVPGVAALVLAPGRALAAQSERPSGPQVPGNHVADYLEGGNNDGDMAFVTRAAVGELNDELLALSQRALMGEAATRVVQELASFLAPYQVQKEGYPPDSAAFLAEIERQTPPGHWLRANLWPEQMVYTRLAPDQVQLHFKGCSLAHVLRFPHTVQAPDGGC